MMRKALPLILTTAVILFFIGCSQKTIKPESVLDTPGNHYGLGMKMMEKGELAEAWAEFERSVGMDPKYAPGYAGMALVEAMKKNYKEAHKYVEKALYLDNKNRHALIAKGRILTLERKGDDWWEKAVKSYDQVLKANSGDSEALYYKGRTYKLAYKFSEAADAFSKVVANKNDWSAKANSEWEVVQKIVRAAPGTKLGKKIALIEKIDRADVAVLFMEELKLAEILRKATPKEYDTGFKPPVDPLKIKEEPKPEKTLPADIQNHWAKNWITEVLDVGAMEVFPDNTFHPDELITRAEYAMLLQKILILVTGDESLATKHFGEESHFPDVNAMHPAYNAIVLAVNRGIMKAKMDGSFGLTENVSGADALLIIRDFQNQLRQTF